MSVSIRCGLAAALVACGMLAANTVEAQDTKPLAARLSGTTVHVNIGTGEAGKSDTLRVDLLRWSTDAERDQLLAAFMKDEKAFSDALAKQPSVGYIWTGGSVGFAIRSAFHAPLGDGGDRIILVTDRQLNSGGVNPWTAAASAGAHGYSFTLVEIHLGRGIGEGKMSLAGAVAADAQAKTLALENYASAPVLLKNVKREP